ncbi:MAG: hypothetical protein IVW53_03005 [Chloroflexi bacterium]|nr:hypothetical protein [Chloroflexota bacterium]
MAEVRRPLHLGVIIGVSASVYAAGLAGVTALQSGADAANRATLGSTADTAGALAAAHADLERRLSAAVSTYDAAAASYDRIAGRLGSLDGKLRALVGVTKRIQGSAIAMPQLVALPAVAAANPVSRSAAQVTTGASAAP